MVIDPGADSCLGQLIFCRLPEGTLTYCLNHYTKSLHKSLKTININRCEISICHCILISLNIFYLHHSARLKDFDVGIFRCSLQSSSEQFVCFRSSATVRGSLSEFSRWYNQLLFPLLFGRPQMMMVLS